MNLETRISESRLVADFLQSKGISQSFEMANVVNGAALNEYTNCDIKEHNFQSEDYTLILVSDKETNDFVEGIVLYSDDLEIAAKAHDIEKWNSIKKQLGAQQN